MNKKYHKYYAELLEQKHDIIKHLQENNKYGLNQALNDSIGELSSYDNHPADIGTEVFERAKDLALREDSLVRLDLINSAIEKLEKGTYGTCERCETMISSDRLDAVPETSFCVECHKHIDKNMESKSRPIEEDFMDSGFGKHNYDNSEHETEFDSEDSWQAVAQYGTSNDPSMMGGETNYNEMYTNSHENEGHYHYEYHNQYVDKTEMEYDEVYDEELENEANETCTIEQQAYQDYLRKQNME
ncbi:TraR/DksA C4-type zinc finger protein [Desulfuribacillus alkaliarsenatis]|uniref:Zinc finger DksA/TraR C4-type domain-containing protein n=1 Tax=Desulfuribacillus alkaliarsenatis TaxID=766136 RepID=A0A1E5FZQ2_9FIRM|nr:TraR/DksA C4-type zinc finger protein [Desulfuribacillus alkaliarsenatis]OEF96056.1 hypothetical protein BHF68_09965 [Desulfuribacillus alkaliarsenatis]